VSFRLGSAVVDGSARVVVDSAAGLHRLDALIDDDTLAGPDGGSLKPLFADWDAWVQRIGMRLAAGVDGAETLDADELRWLAPIRYPGKLICIGRNYGGHNREMGRAAADRGGSENDGPKGPRYPYSFMVPSTTGVVGTGAQVQVPIVARKLDWEAEVAIVIGRRVTDLHGPEALDCIAGYATFNDLSVRDYTIPNAPPVGVDWVMSKAYDGFKPMGPFVLPSAFVEDPDDLRVRAWVNDELKQDGNTSQLIFGFQDILEHLTSIMTLEPGDVIATGTPEGVGHGRKPPEYLSAGDRVVVEVDGLGRLETTLCERSAQAAATDAAAMASVLR
jgi:2-keto-4-pentenoate hydratase/2-oxohepta-3-ene-1,7-dioic acid hydratase in catechol pathway